jgi:hypothetical protein
MILAFTLRFTDLLNDHLLCRLGSDATKIDGWQRVDQQIANDGAFFFRLGVGNRNMRRLILDLLGDFTDAGKTNFTCSPINIGANVIFMPVFSARRFLDSLFHCFQNDIPIDNLFSGNRIGDLQ